MNELEEYKVILKRRITQLLAKSGHFGYIRFDEVIRLIDLKK
jgi:hypothetical protein